MTNELYPDGMWVFGGSEGAQEHDGKSYYPAHLTVRLSRYEALVALESLARQLQHRDLDSIEMDWSGSIERLEDE